jgi:hypothetical protein
MYVVRGELDTRVNGSIMSVIVEVCFKTKPEAEAGLEERTGTYKNLEIIRRAKTKI